MRRYVYFTSFVSLLVALTFGSLIVTDLWMARGEEGFGKHPLIAAGAAVALTLHLGHWILAQKATATSQELRAAKSRWLYIYLTIAILMIGMIITGYAVLATGLDILTDLKRPYIQLGFDGYGPDFYFPTAPPSFWIALPALVALCLYYWRVASRDFHIVAAHPNLLSLHRTFRLIIGSVGSIVLAWVFVDVSLRFSERLSNGWVSLSPNELAAVIVALPLASALPITLNPTQTSLRSAVVIPVFVYGVSALALIIVADAGLEALASMANSPERPVVSSGAIATMSIGLAVGWFAWLRGQRTLFKSGESTHAAAGRSLYLIAVTLFAWWLIVYAAIQYVSFALWGENEAAFFLQILPVGIAIWACHAYAVRSDSKSGATPPAWPRIRQATLALVSIVGLALVLGALSDKISLIERAPTIAWAQETLAETTVLLAGGMFALSSQRGMLRHVEGGDRALFHPSVIEVLVQYVLMFMGLSLVILGLGGVLSVIVRTLASEPFGYGLRRELAAFTSILLIGLPFWIITVRHTQLGSGIARDSRWFAGESFLQWIGLGFSILIAGLFAAWGLSSSVPGVITYINNPDLPLHFVFDIGRPIGFLVAGVVVILLHATLLRPRRRSDLANKAAGA